MSIFKYIHSASVVNEGRVENLNILIEGNRIIKISKSELSDFPLDTEVIDADRLTLLPGGIDVHVHFREPGLEEKADMKSESKAALAGGITSVFEMPNTKPLTITQKALEEKLEIASQNMLCNYGFFFGITNSNILEAINLPFGMACGLKLFLGSSTGNMLVDDKKVLTELFEQSPMVISAHCEDEKRVKELTQKYKEEYGEEAQTIIHPLVRDSQACYLSSKYAIENTGNKTRLNIAHITTEKELTLLSSSPIEEKNITAEVSPSHLWFCDEDYPRLGNKIKCNPAIKTKKDRDALRKALREDKIDLIATDHAPHLLEEKEKPYFSAPSGIPSIQHSMLIMLELVKQGELSIEKMVEKMSHNPAQLFSIKDRGFIKEGYFADLVLVDLNSKTLVDKESLFYKCKWSPLEGVEFSSRILTTIVNGEIKYADKKIISETPGYKVEFKSI